MENVEDGPNVPGAAVEGDGVGALQVRPRAPRRAARVARAPQYELMEKPRLIEDCIAKDDVIAHLKKELAAQKRNRTYWRAR
eukprot:8582068-Pyramimonas_sp.AAC.1